jgi:D-alanyl-lipoteichoic acid acyltransferase DltB (MBOAT superfamily)
VLLDQAALETEARITPLVHEKRRLFNDLLTLKGIHIVFFTAGLTHGLTWYYL